jgi:tryptophan synthase alpha chain
MPVISGIGISTPGQAAEACAAADGVVMASAIIRLLLDGGGPDDAGAFVAEVRAAIDTL